MSEEKKDELQPNVEEQNVEETEATKVEEPAEAPVEQPVEEQPKVDDVKEEEKVEEQAAASDKEDAPIVIDNTAEAPIQPIQDLPRTAKLKEPMSKNKKIAIVVISVIAFIAIFSIVFFPLYFCYFQGRIHVYNETDFVAAAGKRFVLEKDVVVSGDLDLSGSNCNIDLQGHNLTVNGTLTIGANDAAIEIGTLKKGNYTSKGLVTVNALNVTGKDTKFAAAVVSKGSVQVVAHNVEFYTLSAVDKATFNANAVIFNGSFAVANEATAIEFNDCIGVVIGAEIGGNNVVFKNTNVLITNACVGHTFTLDETSTLQALGKLDAVVGGSKVAMLKGHSCPSYKDINLLAIYNASEDTYTAQNCTKLIYLETLPTPVDLMVSEEGGVFKAVCAEVNSYNDVSYQFVMDDKKYDASHDNYVDITDDLKAAGAATHTIKAYVLGNYNFDTLNADTLVSGQTLYLDCETPASIEYSYTLKLSTPTNVYMDTYDGDVFLKFSKVDFADYYVVTIDGTTKYILTEMSSEEFINTHASVANEYGNRIITLQQLTGAYGAPVTEQLSALGYHSLRLVACSFSKEIQTSKDTMTSYKTEKQIALINDNIVATSIKNDDGTYTNTITITGCEDGKLFKLVINGEEVRISNTTYSFKSETSMVGTDVSVQAEAYGYYLASVQRTVQFIAG